nr:MAG TPA: transposase-like protein [Caudoviricetes sp.]
MIFDQYDSPGTMTMGECREKALEEVGYDLITCEHCNGTGIQKD